MRRRATTPAVDAAHLLGGVEAAAVQDGAREAHDAAGGNDDGVSRVGAGVADHVVGLLVADVLDDVARAGAVVREQVHGAVVLAYVDAGNLGDLAREAGLSPSHLSRTFKAQTGISITRFRNQRRLEHFRESYGDGRHTTTMAAALEAGFGSYAQFYRVYRSETGINPASGRGRYG
jgi:AraC-like DNA-binding protein